jgi:hypothetical protein
VCVWGGGGGWRGEHKRSTQLLRVSTSNTENERYFTYCRAVADFLVLSAFEAFVFFNDAVCYTVDDSEKMSRDNGGMVLTRTDLSTARNICACATSHTTNPT